MIFKFYLHYCCISILIWAALFYILFINKKIIYRDARYWTQGPVHAR
jgi:hypothetical protein